MLSLARRLYTRLWVIPKQRLTYRHLSTRDVFRRIYASGVWGGEFCSGEGSADAENYCEIVRSVVTDKRIATVVDLGCGDFRVGKALASFTEYVGVDVVPEMIERNRTKFPGVRFECLDLIVDALPKADLAIVRQVFQHLSNAQIAAALENLKQYRFLLVSEHVPKNPRQFNRDKVHGPDVRAYYGSGVYVDQPPFSRGIACEWNLPLGDDVLRTVLIQQ